MRTEDDNFPPGTITPELILNIASRLYGNDTAEMAINRSILLINTLNQHYANNQTGDTESPKTETAVG